MCKRLTRGGGHLDTLCSFFLCVKFSFSLIGGTGSQNVISRTWEWKSFFLFFLKKKETLFVTRYVTVLKNKNYAEHIT